MSDCVGVKVIKVEVLFFEMFGYVIILRILLLGCVILIMEFLYYVEIFLNIFEEVILVVRGIVNV